MTIILLCNLTPRYLTKKYETLCSHTYKMYANVYISFIHSFQNPEINEVPFNLKMNKQSTRQLQWTTTQQWKRVTCWFTRTWTTLKCILLHQRRQSQNTTHCLILSYDILVKQNYRQENRLMMANGKAGRTVGYKKTIIREFLCNGNFSVITVVLDTQLYSLVIKAKNCIPWRLNFAGWVFFTS